MPLTSDMLISTRASQLAEKNARAARSDARQRSYSEETITPEISLTVSAVLAAFTILTEDLSSLPLILYQQQGRNKFRARQSMYYRLMHDKPNSEHTSMVFREFVLGHMLAWGNFYGQPIFDKRGDVVEIWPLRPDRMEVKRFEGERIYLYRTSDGKQRTFLSEEILHIPAFGFDGLIGYSRIALARNAIGLAISTEKFGSKFFSNGAQPGIVYKHPGELGDDAYDHLKESLNERKGVENSHAPIILEEGMSIEKLGIDPDDAQFLETRKFQVSEVARIFRVPPHMIGDVEKSTSWGTGIDSQEQGYVNHALRPWATRIDQYLNISLLPKDQQESFYYEHLMDALLRGDIQTRYQAYVSAINTGFMSRNEARERENLNPRKGLDAMLQPLNMTTVTTTTSGGGAPVDGSEGENASSSNALEPLWYAAVTRVMTREKNDVMGASKRWQAKGQQEVYERWLESFYRDDHPMFAKKQFDPLMDAYARIYGAHIGHRANLDIFVADFFNDRIEQCKAITHDQLADTIDRYVETATRKFMLFVNDLFHAESSGEDFMEADDDW